MANQLSIQKLVREGDSESLLAILRDPQNPVRRAEAARALAGMENLEIAGSLVNASMEDPDVEVRRAARQALEELVGPANASLAISAYRSNPITTEPWLQASDDPLPSSAVVEEGIRPLTVDPRIAALAENNDIARLELVLRTRESPGYRAAAARMLGDLESYDSEDALAGAVVEDPDAEVCRAARSALEDLLGSSAAEDAVQAYQEVGNDEGPWLIKETLDQIVNGQTGQAEIEEAVADQEITGIDEQDLEETGDSSRWNKDDVHGLMMVLRGDNSSRMRMRAIQALRRIDDLSAIEALALTALWDDDEDVQSMAFDALHDRFGDNTENMLDTYRATSTGMGDLDEGDEEPIDENLEDDNEDNNEINRRGRTTLSSYQGTPVIQEENSGLRFLIFLGLVALAVIFIAFLLFGQGH